MWHLPLQKQLAASQVYAGVLLSSYRDPNKPNVKQVKWVRSHRTLDQATSAEERQEIQRNDEVDALAKAALQCHDDESWEWARQTGKDVDDCPDNWSTLTVWPRLGRVGLRAAPPSGAVNPNRCEMRRQQPHRWAFERKAWRCTLCSRVAKGRSQHNKPAPGKCPHVQNIEHHDRFRLEGAKPWARHLGAFHGSSPFLLLCALRSACRMVHAQISSEMQRSSGL